MSEKFSISPGTSMMDVLGYSGYNLDFAIADLIDNSISGKAKNIVIHFDKKFLYIVDDGVGMTLNELKQAAVIGFKSIDAYREENDLGRYSTGLKSATKSFCNNIFVCSKKSNKKANTIQIDYEHIRKDNVWEGYITNNFGPSKLLKDSGTIVYCTNLDNEKFSNIECKINGLEKNLSHIFGKYLLHKKINIVIEYAGTRPIKVKGWDPFSVPENKSTKIIIDEEYDYHNSKISIKAYILPTYSNLSGTDQKYIEGNKGLLEQQGFYVYRNDRLICEAGWLSLPGITSDDKSKYARLEVNISSKLDKEFNISFSKNALTVPEELKQNFIAAAKKAKTESRKNFDYIKHPNIVRKRKKDEINIWNTKKTKNGLVLSINMSHPLVLELINNFTEDGAKKLISTISKSVPISMIQSQDVITDSYTENEMIELIDATYKKMKIDGIDSKSIEKKMSSIEPFKNYLNILIEYFDNLLGENKDD